MNENPKLFDVVILTEKKYVAPKDKDDYIKNLLLEDRLVGDALEEKGLRVTRTHWDNTDFDWSKAKALLIRSTWDYSDRIDEFMQWIKRVSELSLLINPLSLIEWNIDKHYLRDLENDGVRIVPSYFAEHKERVRLREIIKKNNWKDVVIKPVISCAGRETYKVPFSELNKYEKVFNNLVQKEGMMVQPFLESIETSGEISMMLFGGKYSHAVLKKAKAGDFRVQDDFGGTVHDYTANEEEIRFAEKVIQACKILPCYARVDLVLDNDGNLALSELELIEPELWFRKRTTAANELAGIINKKLMRGE